jgi:hypothetical protein
MKLLFITCVQEHEPQVRDILRSAGIDAFSRADITGFKNGTAGVDLRDSWFAAGEETFDSLLFFSFCVSEKARMAIEQVNILNASADSRFPVRAFLLPVEETSVFN